MKSTLGCRCVGSGSGSAAEADWTEPIVLWDGLLNPALRFFRTYCTSTRHKFGVKRRSTFTTVPTLTLCGLRPQNLPTYLAPYAVADLGRSGKNATLKERRRTRATSDLHVFYMTFADKTDKQQEIARRPPSRNRITMQE